MNRNNWQLIAVVFAALLPLDLQAHCDGKHTGNHPHCSDDGGGGEPGGDANPAFIFKNDRGIHAMDIDGANQSKLGGGKNEDTRNVAWLADGSGSVWTERQLRGGREEPRIRHWDRTTNEISIVLTETSGVDPWVGNQDTIETAIDGCGGTSARMIYFTGFIPDQPGDSSGIFSFDLDNPASLSQVVTEPLRAKLGLAVSRDGQLLATFTLDEDTGPELSQGQLEIRDLCAEGAPVLWSWPFADLGIPDGDFPWLNHLDWSQDFRLAAGKTNEDIWLIDPFPASGPVTAVRLTGPGTGFGDGVEDTSPTWSPDSSEIAFASDGGVYTVNVGSGVVTLLTGTSAREIDWRDNWVE